MKKRQDNTAALQEALKKVLLEADEASRATLPKDSNRHFMNGRDILAETPAVIDLLLSELIFERVSPLEVANACIDMIALVGSEYALGQMANRLILNNTLNLKYERRFPIYDAEGKENEEIETVSLPHSSPMEERPYIEKLQYFALQSIAFVPQPVLSVSRRLLAATAIPFRTAFEAQLVLTVAANVYHFVASTGDPNHPEVLELIDTLHKMLESAVDYEDASHVLLRALGNARHPKSIDVIEKFTKAYGSETLQLPAINSLGKFLSERVMITKSERHFVVQLLLNTYKDYFNEVNVRKAAINSVIRRLQEDDLFAIDQILDAVTYELSPELRRFVLLRLREASDRYDVVGSNIRTILRNQSEILFNDRKYYTGLMAKYVNTKRDIVNELITDIFGVDSFQIDVGKCNIHKKELGDDKAGASFGATFCNVAKLRWPFFGYPKIHVLANDEIYAEVHILGNKQDLARIGIDFEHKTGTWPPNDIDMNAYPKRGLVYRRKESSKFLSGAMLGGQEQFCSSENAHETPISCMLNTTFMHDANSLDKRAVNKLGFYGPDIACPPELNTQCGVAKCTGPGLLGIAECAFARGLQVLNSLDWNFLQNFDPNTLKNCVPDEVPDTDATCAIYADNATTWWLPQEYRSNMKCACEALIPANYDKNDGSYEPTRCVRNFLQKRLKNNAFYDNTFKNSVNDSRTEWNNNKKDLDTNWKKLPKALQDQRIYDALKLAIEAKYFADLLSLANKLSKDWVDAYDKCCCQLKPTWFSAWISILREDIVKLRPTDGCDFIKKVFKKKRRKKKNLQHNFIQFFF